MTKVTGDSQLQSEVLEELSDAQRYRRWLADLAVPHLGDDPIEIGSGNGDYAVEWASSVPTFTVTEADDDRFAALSARFEDHPVVRLKRLMLPFAEPADHSAAVAFNVLEHIPDHVAALRAMAALVRPGGAVILIVPAFPSAMSRFDRAIGHERRYTRASMRATLVAAGLFVEELRYINPIGLLNWYVSVKALGLTPKNGLLLRLYDRTMVPLAQLMDGRVPAPFGQSVLAVARVP